MEQQNNIYSTPSISKKINIGGMVKWGLIGLLAGVFINFFVFLITLLEKEGHSRDFFLFLFSQGKEGNFWDGEFWILVIILTLILGLKGATSKTKRGLEATKIVQPASEEELALIERIIAWISCIIITPIIAGPIMYYIWRKEYPQKARQANDISIIVFLIELALVLLIAFIL